jgi:phospholipid transport system substrate-binding protein
MRRSTTLTVAMTLVLAALGAAWAGAPTDQLREYTEHVVRVLEDASLREDDRRAAVRRIAQEVFDVQETARRALGRHWHGRTPAEREEFVQLFAELMESTYISRIDLYGGERLRFVDEKIDGEHAVVRARIVTRGGTEVPVEGRMLRRGERWLIYDVVIEGVSLIANYRSQFDRIIRSSSFADLVKRLRDRTQSLERPARPLAS